jgi:hypothetical protein
MQCDEWDPRILYNPDQAETPSLVREKDNDHYAPTRPMAVLIHPTIEGRVDGFIDGLINIFLSTEWNCARAPHVVPLAM